jgi:hypothetical protein
MTISIARVRELKDLPAGGRLLTEDELEAVTGGCVLVQPGPKGNPVPEVSF